MLLSWTLLPSSIAEHSIASAQSDLRRGACTHWNGSHPLVPARHMSSATCTSCIRCCTSINKNVYCDALAVIEGSRHRFQVMGWGEHRKRAP